MRINFVMSNDVYSGIFSAIIGYFKEFKPEYAEIYVTQYPVVGMDIYHYHRPNLESELLENSVVTVHHDLEDTDPWFDASMFTERYHEADRIVCLNSMQKDYLNLNEDLDNTVVIPHGVNTKIFTRKKCKSVSGKLTVGIVSKRYGRRVKGEALLTELYKRLNPENIKFIFVGEGRSLDAAEAEYYGIESLVYESLPYSMFDNLYSELDILLIPSLFEGGPANVPEALYTKVPIVGRKIAMLKDLVVEGENGFFLTGNPDKDAILINNLAINSNDIYSNLITNLNESDDLCVPTWKEVVKLHFNLYEEMLLQKQQKKLTGESV